MAGLIWFWLARTGTNPESEGRSLTPRVTAEPLPRATASPATPPAPTVTAPRPR